MRIGINALYLIPGGVGGSEMYLRRLLEKLLEVDRTNEYVLYTNAEAAGTFGFSAPNLREVACRVHATNRPSRIIWEQTALPLHASRDAIDVLHSPAYTAPLPLRCASVVTIHDVNYHFHPEDWSRAALWANRLLVPAAARTATRVLTVSRASRDAIVSVLKVPEHKIDVVYSGVDDNLAASTVEVERAVRSRYGLGGRFILSVSATYPHKNVDGLVRAYDQFASDEDDPPPLVIVGLKARHHPALEKLLAQRKHSGRVVLTGWLDAAELAALYRAATLFVFASKYEGFGFPVLEAMSVGTPVVSSNATSLPELVGDAGLLVDPGDADALAKAMRRACSDEPLRRTLVARGHQQAAQFTWARAAQGTLESYRAAYQARSRG